LAGQNLHMEAKETEELLDWIAAEAGLEEVSFDLTTIKKCCKKNFSNRKLMYALFGITQVFFAVHSHSILLTISTHLMEILIKVL
jgi:hypothetical protein